MKYKQLSTLKYISWQILAINTTSESVDKWLKTSAKMLVIFHES